MPDQNNLVEKYFVSRMLFGSIERASVVLDAFSGWFLTGYAAVAAFIFANLGSASQHASEHSLRWFFGSFIAVMILGIVEKMLAVLVAAACAGARIGDEMGDKAATLNYQVVLGEAERALLLPMRFMLRRAFEKVEAGDLAATARNYTKLTQVQALLAVLQVLVALIVAFILIDGVSFNLHPT